MKKVAIVFPGQGSQCVAMGKTLCEEYRIAREVYEEANDILNIDIKRICSEGSISEVSNPENVQLALFTNSVALYRVYMSQIGIDPVLMAGHSLGEYMALVCADILSFKDALQLVKLRSKLTKEIIDQDIGSMTIIEGAPLKSVEEYCAELSDKKSYAVVSCYNSLEQIAISGHKNIVEKVEDKLIKNYAAQITPLYGSAPFHSELMRPIVGTLKEKVKKFKTKPSKNECAF